MKMSDEKRIEELKEIIKSSYADYCEAIDELSELSESELQDVLAYIEAQGGV